MACQGVSDPQMLSRITREVSWEPRVLGVAPLPTGGLGGRDACPHPRHAVGGGRWPARPHSTSLYVESGVCTETKAVSDVPASLSLT